MQNIRNNFGEVMERLAGTLLQLAPELDADTPDLALGLLESGCGWLSAIVVSDAFQFFRRQVITVRHVQLIVLHVAARVSWRNLDMKQSKRKALVSSLNKVHLVAQEFIGNKVCSTDKGADGLVARLLADKSDKIVKAIKGLLVGWQKGGVDVESAATLEEQKSAGTGEVTKSALGAGVTPEPESESDQKTESALERGPSSLTPSPFRSKPDGGELVAASEYTTPLTVMTAHIRKHTHAPIYVTHTTTYPAHHTHTPHPIHTHIRTHTRTHTHTVHTVSPNCSHTESFRIQVVNLRKTSMMLRISIILKHKQTRRNLLRKS